MCYQLLIKFFRKYFVVHERSVFKNSFSTCVWSKLDSFFCDFLYILWCISWITIESWCTNRLFIRMYKSKSNPKPLFRKKYWIKQFSTVNFGWRNIGWIFNPRCSSGIFLRLCSVTTGWHKINETRFCGMKYKCNLSFRPVFDAVKC